MVDTSDRPGGELHPDAQKVLETVRRDMKPRLIESCDRVTCQLALHHEHCGEQPVSVQLRFCNVLSSIQQPYIRRLKFTTEWERLDMGWLTSVSDVVLENKMPAINNIQLTDAQKLAAQDRILEVSTGPDENKRFGRIRPGRFMFLEPTCEYWVRSTRESVTANLTAMPE